MNGRITHQSRTGGRARAGFTLVEMMGVIVILGLIVGVVSVSWKAILPHEELNAEVRRLSDMLQTARSEAISRSAEYRIVYDQDDRAYWLAVPFRDDGSFEPEPEKRRALFRHQLAEGIRFEQVTIDGDVFNEGEEVFVRFDAVGSSNAHTVVLKRDAPEAWFTIEVLALTGLIRFHDGLYEREEATDADFD